MKKRYRFELNSFQYYMLILALFCIGGLLFSFGLMVGYYQSRSSYEQIMAQSPLESPGENRVSLFEVTGGPGSQKPPSTSNIANKLSPEQSFCVQVGAFRKKTDAQRLRNKLDGKGYDAFVNFAELGKNGNWHRVRVGKFHDRQAAEKLSKVLLSKEKIKGLVIKQ